jgi:membrane-bound ClpP family serine protease
MAINIENKEDKGFALGKENIRLLAVGFVIIVIGFILMIGGKSDDLNVFNKEIFNFQRITLAPIVVMVGFIFEIYAIMKKPGSEK